MYSVYSCRPNLDTLSVIQVLKISFELEARLDQADIIITDTIVFVFIVGLLVVTLLAKFLGYLHFMIVFSLLFT